MVKSNSGSGEVIMLHVKVHFTLFHQNFLIKTFPGQFSCYQKDDFAFDRGDSFFSSVEKILKLANP